MARIWKDRAVEHPRRYRDQNNNILILTPDPGEILEVGTPVNAANMNAIEGELSSIKEAIDNSDLNELRDYGRYSFIPLINNLAITDEFATNPSKNMAYAVRDIVMNGGLNDSLVYPQATASKFIPELDFEGKSLFVKINCRRVSAARPTIAIYKNNNEMLGELIGAYSPTYTEAGLNTTFKVITYEIPITQKLFADEEYYFVIRSVTNQAFETSFSPANMGRPALNCRYTGTWVNSNPASIIWTDQPNKFLDFDLPQLYKSVPGEKHTLEQTIEVPELYSWGNIKWDILNEDAEVLIKILDTNNNLIKESRSINGIDLTDISSVDYPTLKFKIEVVNGETKRYTMINPTVTFENKNTQLYTISGTYQGDGEYSKTITLTDYDINVEAVLVSAGGSGRVLAQTRFNSRGFMVYLDDGNNTNGTNYQFKVFYRR